MNDRELVQAVVGGNQAAACELVQTHRRLIMLAVRRYAQLDSHLVDDLEQDAWLAIFRTLDRYDPEIAKLSTWIFTVAKTAVLESRHRRAKVRAVSSYELERYDEHGDRYASRLELEPGREPDPYELFERCEALRMIEDARACLSPRQRQIVDLYLAGVDPGEVRVQLGCTRENVNYLMHRSAEKIRAVLRESATRAARVLAVELPN